MLTIRIHNDGTGTQEAANYDYVVDVNGEIIAQGRVEGHNRDDGWVELVRQMVEMEQGKVRAG